MKLSIVLACLAVGGANAAFTIRPPAFTGHKVALNVATGTNDFATKSTSTRKVTPSVPVNEVSKAERSKMADRVIDPDYSLAVQVLLLAPLIAWYHPSYMADGSPSIIGVFGACFHVVFAALLWVQTLRVRLVFEKDAMEFYNVKGPRCDLEKGARLVRKPNNYVSGTQNRWNYDTITNYGFFPSIDFPVIIYLKETETPKEQWNKWFAAFDGNNGAGQPHFFPGICSARQIRTEFEKRGIKRKPVRTMKDIGKDGN
ncbi:Protein of unknown function (DUF3119) [Seminavis robusta]|uniref:Uncharacterized protein n=1 Tax=Seminavis robusta TaxID=568900 RepID=A0A9N8DKZ4_9STRA|nr:Protein of unknown function (DUF3119) [Seminavis robusta]|eukprot:Sro199_g084550.1 Protein of unknown function (DUF3119) (257) ;mRNA; r:90786-91731